MLFTVCLFAWDDFIDTNEDALASDFEKASVWRQQTLDYFKYHLQLCPSESNEPCCPDDVCLLFKEFGARFCAKFGEGMLSVGQARVNDMISLAIADRMLLLSPAPQDVFQNRELCQA